MKFEINGDTTIVYDSRGNSFLIDTDQLERIKVCNWYVDHKGYVRTASKKYNRIFLHRFLLNTNSQVDHKNRIKTDNRLCNIRECTTQENNRNRVYKNTKSGVQGVQLVIKNGKTKYRPRVCINGKKLSFGYFDSLEEARRVREEKASEYFLSYAPCNSEK